MEELIKTLKHHVRRYKEEDPQAMTTLACVEGLGRVIKESGKRGTPLEYLLLCLEALRSQTGERERLVRGAITFFPFFFLFFSSLGLLVS